jgi:hypothetical protein
LVDSSRQYTYPRSLHGRAIIHAEGAIIAAAIIHAYL